MWFKVNLKKRIYSTNNCAYVRVIGAYKDVLDLIKKLDIGIILLADNRISREEFNSLTEITAKTMTRFVVVPDVFGALKNLIVIPPFYTGDLEAQKYKNTPCYYCIGKYSRLEIEC